MVRNILTSDVFLSKNITLKMRGLAMLLILVGHIIGSFGDRPFIPFLDNRFFTPLGGVGCAIFLFVSGYGLNESYKRGGQNHYWSKRLLTLLIPYVLCILFFYLVSPLSPLMNEVTIESLQESKWYWNYYWFIQYIFIWYILFYVIKKIASNYTTILTIVISIFLFFFIRSEYMAEQSFSFALGVIVSQNRDTLLKKCNMKTIWIVSLASLLVGIAALGIKQIPIIRGAEGYRFVYLLCQLFIKLPLGLFLMIVLHSLNLKGIGILAFVGTIAYELYLVQMPYLETLQNSYSRTFIFVLQTLLMSYILYKMDNIIIKKLQFLNT